jgi:hypothetical protein
MEEVKLVIVCDKLDELRHLVSEAERMIHEEALMSLFL